MSEPTSPVPASQQQPVDPNARLLLDKQWEEVQRKTFTKWVNSKLKGKCDDVVNLAQDFSDGVKLIRLLQIIGDDPSIKVNKNPKLRLHKIENLNTALHFIKSRGVNLYNIGAEDIVDANDKLVLGMVWTIILRFSIADISEGELRSKEGLLLWCQRKTKGYRDVNVKEFTNSWQDGLAFCALIHRHRPDLLDFDSLDKSDREKNLELAFETAEKIGIPRLLDVEDVARVIKPDERSVITYVAQYFHAFSNSDKVETAGRRVGKLAAACRSAWEMQNDYERRVRALIASITETTTGWSEATFDGSYADAMSQSEAFLSYKKTDKRSYVKEKRALETLLGNINTKLRTYKLAPYHPPEGCRPADLESVWVHLFESELVRQRSINENIRSIKESIRVQYAEAANSFAQNITQITQALAAVDGELDAQLEAVDQLLGQANALSGSYGEVEALYQATLDAHIEENDHTQFIPDDLHFDLSVVTEALQKKRAFIENQKVSQNFTNVTAAQLEEIETTFRFFDVNHNNALSDIEFKAGLSGLGINLGDDEEFLKTFTRVSGGTGQVTFEQFVDYMVSITEDRQTADQIVEAFRILAQNKDYITKQDLQFGQIPSDDVEFLVQAMPQVGDATHDYQSYVSNIFSEN